MSGDFISIDQNSHSLWDAIPKLQALVCSGLSGTHFVEDIDVAFTRRGATAEDRTVLLAPERYYRGGTSDWGAALFYTDFLGRNALDVRDLEAYTGWTTAALSRRLAGSVDALYDRYSPSDNWQLIGSSYAGHRDYHRAIGDLTVAEVAPHLRQLIDHAEQNLLETFPGDQARQRIRAWFAGERDLVVRLIDRHRDGRLIDIYRDWLREHLPESVRIDMTSRFVALDPVAPHCRLLNLFVKHYDKLAALYNEAVAETGVALNQLRPDEGELPFFLVLERDGALVRTPAFVKNGCLHGGRESWSLEPDQTLPLAKMAAAGVCCVAGKALLLVLQARLNPGGAPLALPYNGSVYMPAARRLEQKLRASGLFTSQVHPVYRVKFNFIAAFANCPTLIRLPRHLSGAFSARELPAADFAREVPGAMARAKVELARLKTKEGREALQQDLCPDLHRRRAALDASRLEIARDPARRAETADLWNQIKELDRQLLEALVDRIVRNLHVLDLDYWNSRGALMPWCVALGGRELYQRLIEEAEIYSE